jgi:hypothetical protein
MTDDNKQEYNPADKWGAPTSSYDDAMAMKKLIGTSNGIGEEEEEEEKEEEY